VILCLDLKLKLNSKQTILSMILSNTEISDEITRCDLIENHTSSSIKNCSYKIKIGEIVEPETGNVINSSTSQPVYIIKPSEVVIIQSKEKLNLPENITASYSALYSISKDGILLINSSMIESGYSGKLSGFLMNFSAQPVIISIGQEIAKLNFIRVNQIPNPATPQIINDNDYLIGLKKDAIKYHKSFLNIKGISEKISKSVLSNVKKFSYSGGIVILFLILFASTEPLFSKWLWEKTGVGSASERFKMELLLNEISHAKKDIEIFNKNNKKLIDLQKQIDSLKQNVNKKTVVNQQLIYTPKEGYDLIANQYDNWKWQKFWHNNESCFIEDWGKTLNKGVGLDAGTGSGNNLDYFLRNNHEVTAVDISTEMLHICKNKHHNYILDNKLHCKELDIRDLIRSQVKFDWIICNRVISHIENIDSVFKLFSNILKPNGQCFISNVHPNHNYNYTGINVDNKKLLIETFHHSIEEVKISMKKYNFEILNFVEVNSSDLISMPSVIDFPKLLNQSSPIFYYSILKLK
jgi:2-polyprenyl-3-methyl-5-hydroxy-6-metoxy-1,4-benzoquinol methylase/dUTPase